MNVFNYNRIQELIDQGYNFDISRYISESFDIVKKELGLFIGYTAVVGLIFVVAAFIPFIGSLAVQFLAPTFLAGYLIVAHKMNRNEEVEFGDFFKGFDYFGQLLLQVLIVMGISLVLFIPLGFFLFLFGGFEVHNFDRMSAAGFIILILLSIIIFILFVYISVSYLFAPAFIVFGDLQPWDAMEASRKIVGQNFFPVFGFTLVLGLLVLAGYVLCCVGLLFTLPAYQVAVYCAFKDIMDFDNPEQQDRSDIYDHLVD